MYSSKITYLCVSFAATAFLFYIFLGPPKAHSDVRASSFSSRLWDNQPWVVPNVKNTNLLEEDQHVASKHTHLRDNLYDVQNETLGVCCSILSDG